MLVGYRRGVLRRVGFGATPVGAVAVAFGAVWAGVGQDLVRVDRRSGRIRARLHLGARPAVISAGSGALWVAGFLAQDSVLFRIDPYAARVRSRVRPGGRIDALAAGDGALWIASVLGTVIRLDVADGQLTRRRVS